MRILVCMEVDDHIRGLIRELEVERVIVLTDKVVEPRIDDVRIDVVSRDLWHQLAHELGEERATIYIVLHHDVKLMLRLARELLIKNPAVHLIYNSEVI